ncbi:methyltransferase domain-containing protein [Paeniroseomonas aquatica]|uniref:methyltransferase domain-containing protein n=1 Tax=Paeniroseomonas aquatica TaxID=373043 RepID=UPI00361537C9
MTHSDDTLLGGRVRLRQPVLGLRAGLDTVLLAAGIPARPGQQVLEAGCGSGAAFLCLAARVPGLRIIAVERDPALAALAAANAAANGVAAEVITGDIRDAALARRLPPCDHAFANPPFWPHGTTPPVPQRGSMTHAPAGAASLADWARFLATPLSRRGTLSLILPAVLLDSAMAALAAAGCAGTRLVPFWPRGGCRPSACCCRPGAAAAARPASPRGWCCTPKTASPRRRRPSCAMPQRSRPADLSPRPCPGGGDATAAHAPRPGFPCCGAGWCPARPGGASASSRGCAAIAPPPRSRPGRRHDGRRSGSCRTDGGCAAAPPHHVRSPRAILVRVVVRHTAFSGCGQPEPRAVPLL